MYGTRSIGIAAIILLPLCADLAKADSATVTNTASAVIAANGTLSVPAGVTLTSSSTPFSGFTGTLSVQYHARTSAAGSGNIVMKVLQDFQNGGPSVALGDLTYNCGAASLGTSCSTTAASTSSATNVVSLPSSACSGGSSPCSGSNPNTVVLTFTLADRPAISTGTFTAVVQFTISAT